MYTVNYILLLPFCFFCLYLMLESLDWGLGLASTFFCKNDDERKVVLKLFRPGFDGNELWFILSIITVFLFIDVQPNYLNNIKILFGVVILGFIIRLIFSWFIETFKKPIFIKLISLVSLLSLFIIGLFLFYSLNDISLSFSLIGIVSSIWMICSSLQIGCLYGAIKTVNPLAERFRAGFLVVNIIHVLIYLLFSILLKTNINDLSISNTYYWMCVIFTLLFSIASFYFVRKRNVKIGFIFAYLSLIFSFFICFIVRLNKFLALKQIDVVLENKLSDSHMLEFILFTGLITLSSFLYKIARKKIIYSWKDSI